MIRIAACQCPCHALSHPAEQLSRPAVVPANAGNEMRARWGSIGLSGFLDLDAVPAYDENGVPIGWVAIDADALKDAVAAYVDRAFEEGF